MGIDRKQKIGIDNLDVRIAIAVGICLFTAKLVPYIKYMPACFAAILCMQDDTLSWQSNRVLLCQLRVPKRA